MRHATILVAVQFCYGGLGVLHWEGCKTLETVGVVHGHLMDFVITILGDSQGCYYLIVVLVEVGGGGNYLYIHAQRVHVRDSPVWCPLFLGVNVRLFAVGCQTMPVSTGFNGTQETLRVGVGVNVDRSQLGSPQIRVLELCLARQLAR